MNIGFVGLKAFAAAVSREDIATGIGELAPLTGFDDAAHIEFCILAIREQGAQTGV